MQNIKELSPSNQIAYDRAIRLRLNQLRKIKRLGVINRMLCLVCVCPFLYTATCLGQKKEIPPLAIVGGMGFIACIVGAGILNGKEEKISSEINHIHNQYHARTR